MQSGSSAFGVNVIGFVSARLGIGVAARASIAALVASGVPVSVVDVQLPDGRSGVDHSWAHLYVPNADTLPHPVNLMHVHPPEAMGLWGHFPHWFTTRYTYAVPFFELADLPDIWYPHLSRYDAILAPTEHVAAAARNRLSIPVRHYPVSADIRDVNPAPRSAFAIPEDRFAFVATWDTDSGLNRKNGIGTLRAFASAFAGRSDATLVLKVNGGARHPELERELARMPAGLVTVVDTYLPYADVVSLYAACDAFISLHRAEGLGLGPLEAMLLGKPVVATGWSGSMDFMDEASAALVRFTFTPVLDSQPLYAPSQFRREQLWAEPDLLHAATIMRRLVDDRAYAAMLGAAAKVRADRRRTAFFGGAAAQTVRSLYEANVFSASLAR